MQSWPDEQLVRLRGLHPAWFIWYVPRYLAGYSWCAKRHDHEIAEINADSPADLENQIAEIEREQS